MEIQFKRNLPFRYLFQLKNYLKLDLLRGVSFWKAGRKRDNLNITESLAAEGLLRKIDEVGIQVVSKMYSPQQWAYVSKKFLQTGSESDFPDLNRLLRQGLQNWLEDEIRFPRLRTRSQK